MPGETVQEVVRHRAMITACTIGATVLQLLDQTIANVALPFMQGSFSASFDEISWVLTSYITASAIMTAPVGWLAARYGRKALYVSSILGFTITSMLCGAAQSLGQIVVFRVLQGAFGAALAPLSQATLLDIYPPERRGWHRPQSPLHRRCLRPCIFGRWPRTACAAGRCRGIGRAGSSRRSSGPARDRSIRDGRTGDRRGSATLHGKPPL